MDPKARAWECADWFDLGPITAKWRTLVNKAMKFQVPQNVGNFMTRSHFVRIMAFHEIQNWGENLWQTDKEDNNHFTITFRTHPIKLK
jgi:hypothetical protein